MSTQIEQSVDDSFSHGDYAMRECISSSSDSSNEPNFLPSPLVTNSCSSSNESEIDSSSSTKSNESFNALDLNYTQYKQQIRLCAKKMFN